MQRHAILSSFSLTPGADTFLRLSCRPCGLLSWPLSRLRLVDTAQLSINRECLNYRSSSLKSFNSFSVPLANVTSVAGGSQKPYGYLVVGALLALLCIPLLLSKLLPAAFICLLLAALTAMQYLTRQYFYLLIEHGDDSVFCLCLHPGLIEGIIVQPQQVDIVCSLIRQAMLKAGE